MHKKYYKNWALNKNLKELQVIATDIAAGFIKDIQKN